MILVLDLYDTNPADHRITTDRRSTVPTPQVVLFPTIGGRICPRKSILFPHSAENIVSTNVIRSYSYEHFSAISAALGSWLEETYGCGTLRQGWCTLSQRDQRPRRLIGDETKPRGSRHLTLKPFRPWCAGQSLAFSISPETKANIFTMRCYLKIKRHAYRCGLEK